MILRYFAKVWHHWKVLLYDRAYLISLFVGVFVLVSSYFVTFFVSSYNDFKSYVSVGDFILDNIPTYNLEFLFTWGIYSTLAFIFAYFVFERQELLPFALKTFGLLLFVRSGFIVLTHVGPPSGFFYEDSVGPIYDSFTQWIFRNDLFFSGHTAIPFMAFLLLKDYKVRWLMLFSSIAMGVTVLLMHVHYSIDVFAAFFITHGIYALSDRIFNNLNLRFKLRLKKYDLNSLQRRLNEYRERKALGLEAELGIEEEFILK
jgi:hypothetical protein